MPVAPKTSEVVRTFGSPETSEVFFLSGIDGQ